MTVPLAQQEPRLRRFPLRRHRLSAAGGTLSMVAPRSADRAFQAETVRHFDRVGQLPYWAEIWPAAVAIARVVLRGERLAGRRALDLGCGLGLAGSAAARHGAEVLVADRDPDALEFARFNVRHNSDGRAVRAVLHDWDRGPVAGSFDLILLADVTYEDRHHAPILRQLEAGLGHQGRVLHAEPFRDESTRFLERAASQYSVESSAVDTHFEGVRVRIRLSSITAHP